MGWLLLIIITAWVFYKMGKSANPVNLDFELTKRNREWAEFIAGYRKVVKSAVEKSLINRILKDMLTQGQNVADLIDQEASLKKTEPIIVSSANQISEKTSTNTNSDQQIPESSSTNNEIKLDNASLLLYFGAFLFVSSAGLFVALGSVTGGIKTSVVVLVGICFYWLGLWLYKNKKDFEQAGMAFTGIGMSVIPLAGLAAYQYMFDQQNGPMIWFATSSICLALYWHALVNIRKRFMDYVFVFTFLSLFEASISLFSSPIYYYGWGMALVGIMFSWVKYIRTDREYFKEAAQNSSEILVPLAAVGSFVMVGNYGFMQLGVSLLIASVYYLSEAVFSNLKRSENYVVGHITLLMAVGVLTYSVNESLKQVIVALTIVNLFQWCYAILVDKSKISLFSKILVSSTTISAIMSINQDQLMLMAFCLATLVPMSVWLRLKESWYYLVSSIFLVASPIIYGQVYMDPRLDANDQAIVSLVFLAIQVFIYAFCYKKDQLVKEYAQAMITINTVTVLVVGYLLQGFSVPALCASVVTLLILAYLVDKDLGWLTASSIIIAFPLLKNEVSSKAFALALLVALIFNIVIAIRFRQEFNRWFGTFLWLLLPVGLGFGSMGEKWSNEVFALAYLLSATGMILARSIAMGIIFMSSKVKLSAYEKSASLAYIFGYWLSVAVAVVLALMNLDIVWLMPTVLSILLVLTLVMGYIVEKNDDYIGQIPLLASFILASVLRPSVDDATLTSMFCVGSILLSLGFYTYYSSKNEKLAQYAIAGSFIPVFSVMFWGLNWGMPVALISGGMMMYHFCINRQQNEREISGVVITSGIMWLLWYFGVRDIQAYAHIMAGLFAIYAYQRGQRKESQQQDSYIVGALGTATVPLAMAALSGISGGIYGWWLLLEQVLFMYLGVAFAKRFVFRWGLYVGVAAVLFQLRDLAWAALTFLALVVISVAVYEIQKKNN